MDITYFNIIIFPIIYIMLSSSYTTICHERKVIKAGIRFLTERRLEYITG